MTGSSYGVTREAGWTERARELVEYVPNGRTIPEEMWRSRHRKIVLVTLAHLPFLLGLGLYEGTESVVTGATIPAAPAWMLAAPTAVVVVLAAVASLSRLDRRARTVTATLAAMTTSMMLVKYSGGYIEAHFHFFILMAVIAVYEDWLPFLVGMVYVGGGHAAFGLIDASLVYNHPAAIENPMAWGGIHAVFITGLALALMGNWVSIEKSREEAERRLEQVEQRDDEIEEVEAAMAEVEERREEVERINDHLEAKADDYSATMARAADGDLTVRLDTESESEAMTRIGTAFNGMMDDIEAAMRDIQSFADAVAGATERTATGVSAASDRSESVHRSVAGIAEGADEQRETLTEVSGEMNDLSATIEEVASSAETVAETARGTAEVANEGEATARRAIDDAEEAQETLDATVENVRALDERMSEIGEIIDLIGDIAEQTNLLALNANIEAARAGSGGSDGGDGFSVVAAEVKDLAEETREAAAEIEELIHETQEQTERTVEEARTAERHMGSGVEAVHEAAAAFERVTENAEEADDGIREISRATDDQAASTEEAVAMVEGAVEISRETAAETDDLAATADEQVGAMDEVAEEVESLADRADRLRRLLSEFAVDGGDDDPETADGVAGSGVAVGDGGRRSEGSEGGRRSDGGEGGTGEPDPTDGAPE